MAPGVSGINAAGQQQAVQQQPAAGDGNAQAAQQAATFEQMMAKAAPLALMPMFNMLIQSMTENG